MASWMMGFLGLEVKTQMRTVETIKYLTNVRRISENLFIESHSLIESPYLLECYKLFIPYNYCKGWHHDILCRRIGSTQHDTGYGADK